MKQVLQDYDSGELSVQDVPVPTARQGEVLVRNQYSAISCGTERTMIELAEKSLLGKARERPDLVKKVIRKVRNDGLFTTLHAVRQRLKTKKPLGYSCGGEVVEIGTGVDSFQPGDRVACGGADYASHAEYVSVPRNLVVSVPDSVRLNRASMVTIGSIAMQGIRRAELTPGERVGVIGLGLVGQMTVLLLRAYGYPVLGTDIQPQRLDQSRDLGINRAVQADNGLNREVRQFSNGQGLDAVIITASTSGNQTVEQAGDISRQNGRISVVGNVGMDLPRETYYEKELDLRVSRSYGPGRYDRSYEEKGNDYPFGHVRWTENRNMQEFIRLLDEGLIDPDPLITHTFSFGNVLDAYDLIRENDPDTPFTGIVLEYEQEDQEPPDDFKNLSFEGNTSTDVTAGIIGAGTFARGTMMPILDRTPDLTVRAIASASGRTAADLASRYDIEQTTSDYRELLETDLDAVFILTRHHLHTPMAVDAVQAGKHVFVEKPLALNSEQLDTLTSEARGSNRLVTVGFNRRFAPATRRVVDTISTDAALMMQYRVNANEIDPDSWIYDPEEGGGRIVGEACHFIDLFQHVSGAKPERVYASALPANSGRRTSDNVTITLNFSDGSRGVLLYTTSGDRSLAKEYGEFFGAGQCVTIDNFKTGFMNMSQDKGHENEIRAFVSALSQNGENPVPLNEAIATTRTTFRVKESLQTGQAVAVE